MNRAARRAAGRGKGAGLAALTAAIGRGVRLLADGGAAITTAHVTAIDGSVALFLRVPADPQLDTRAAFDPADGARIGAELIAAARAAGWRPNNEQEAPLTT